MEQETEMKRTEILAYTAGIIDGEGSIRISRQKRNACRSGSEYNFEIVVVNSNEWLIQWLKMQYGGYIYRAHLLPPRKDCWRWVLRSNNGASFLKLILPYLNLKKPQAGIAIKFQKRRRRGGYLTNKELTDQETSFNLMRNLNKKGK